MFKILISTVDDKFMKRKYIPKCEYLLINQLINKDNSDYKLSNVFSFKEKGLSKSRNKALELCDGDIALISDDDVEYVENLQEIIIRAFEENRDADIITFQVKIPDGKLFKENYKNFKFTHNIKTIMRVSSIEIAFRINSIKEKNLQFDESFGLGTQYPTGEEAIFLYDAMRKGLKIIYLPIPIVYHPKESSGGMFKNNPILIKAKGAMFYRIFGIKSYLISLLFACKKYKISNYSFFEFFSYMLEGIKKYKIGDKKII